MFRWLMRTRRRAAPRATLLALALLGLLLAASPAPAEVRIGDLSVFFNDYDVTVQVVLLGAIPETMHEGIQTGFATHVRYYVELWQYTPWGVDRRLQARTVERQLTYNVLTKEYKVVSLGGEQREPFLTKELREAQRVVSELRADKLAPATSLDPKALYYVRVRSDVSLGGVNTWFARATGDAEETPWVQSSYLTPTRSQ